MRALNDNGGEGRHPTNAAPSPVCHDDSESLHQCGPDSEPPARTLEDDGNSPPSQLRAACVTYDDDDDDDGQSVDTSPTWSLPREPSTTTTGTIGALRRRSSGPRAPQTTTTMVIRRYGPDLEPSVRALNDDDRDDRGSAAAAPSIVYPQQHR